MTSAARNTMTAAYTHDNQRRTLPRQNCTPTHNATEHGTYRDAWQRRQPLGTTCSEGREQRVSQALLRIAEQPNSL